MPSVDSPSPGIGLPTLSIIVPVLNERRSAPLLRERLRSLAGHEVVVVDGGSSDGTPDLLRPAASSEHRLVVGPRGRARQMNLGADASRGDALVFVHADTDFSPGHARAVQQAVAAGAHYGCFALRLDSSDPRLRLVGRLISLRSHLLPSATGDQAIFVRRDLFDRLGGYREIALCEDLDLIRRARPLGRFVCLGPPVVTSARRWEQRGVVRTVLLMWLLRAGCHLGIDPAVLKRVYDDVR